ncbi:hypothetical protein PVAND_015780 [Polypedilum vanderplanki]|uniref:UDENN domain-containing protein n=1 Tax=Polypedilum vanderplanki TaxID=319348 RepID=A0A9J6BE71_POLVA|nr:hypothetical protein PVAND_015780 [Polypedilum vanderplanki]
MNHVQAIKNQFERLNVSDAAAPQLRETSHEIKSFKRAATLMDFSSFQLNGEASTKIQFQRQDSNSKSVRRRGAFRLEKKPDVVKSPKLTNNCDIEEELQYLATSETIKKALRQPLPQGSPPKKPPRTFASTPLNSPIAEVKEFVPTPTKTTTKLIDGMKFLNCIISPCSIDPIYYEQIKAERRQQVISDDDEEEEEQIYMEPSLQKFDVVTKKEPEELHYMCTNIIDQNFDTNESSSLESFTNDSNEVQSYNKLNILMDVMYDERKRDRILDDDSSSSSTEVKLPKGKVSRSLTEKRKNYIRRMTQTITTSDFRESSGSATSVIKQFQRIIDSNNGNDKQNGNKNETKLFKMALLVGYDMMNKKGYIKSIYPSGETPLPMLEQFVYPSNKNPCDLMVRENQNFMMILTDVHGNHLFGYCRQIIPEGFEKCLPLTYCIITEINASGFYFNLLNEIESRHGISNQQFISMMKSLHSKEFPKSNEIFTAKFLKPPPDIPKKPDPDLIQKSTQKFAKRLSLESPEWLKSETSKLIIARSDEITIRREIDVRLESFEMSILYESTNRELLIAIFGTLLIERKVILVGQNLSQLSSCVMALYSILYPFKWPHPIITVIPEQIIELLQAPFPFFAGVLKTSIDVNSLEIEDGIVVDLDSKTLLRKCGDEATLLPETLRKSLLLALKIVDAIDKGKKLINVLIAEAFLQFFIKLFAGLKASDFEKEKFIESHTDQGIKYFLEWFLDTILFKEFLIKKQQYDQQKDANGTFELFNIKILGKSATLATNQQKKNVEMLFKSAHHKKRNFKDKIKDFLNH